MIEQALNMVNDFLNNRYEPLDFSYDFPDFLIEHYDEMEEENKTINAVLNENMPEICADYEMGENPDYFKERVKEELEDYIWIGVKNEIGFKTAGITCVVYRISKGPAENGKCNVYKSEYGYRRV